MEEPTPPCIHDPIGLGYLFQLRVGHCKLNFHKFNHNFRDTVNPMCSKNDGIEDTEHFSLLCPSFDIQRRDLLAEVSELLSKSITFQATFCYNTYCMVIKNFLMT